MKLLASLKWKIKFLLIRLCIPTLLNIYYLFFKPKEKSLLIIKADGIGDYILFRNYLQFLHNSLSYKGYKIYLLGNVSYKELAIYLDSDIVDGFYWYADNYFLSWKLIRLLIDLQKLQLTTIFYANYSRKFTVDWLINNVRATHKIGVTGNNTNELPLNKTTGEQFYTRLLPVDNAPVHEFQRNRQIVEALTGQKCNYQKPAIDSKLLNIKKNNQVVVFTGSSNAFRKWGGEHFTALCKKILSTNYKITLAGGINEIAESETIAANVNKRLNNQVGILTLVELCELIGGAKLLISHDTVAIHIAAAMNVKSVCISRGDLYGRFVPYPDEISDKIACVFPDKFIKSTDNYNNWSDSNIKDISVEKVFSIVKEQLNDNKN